MRISGRADERYLQNDSNQFSATTRTRGAFWAPTPIYTAIAIYLTKRLHTNPLPRTCHSAVFSLFGVGLGERNEAL